MGPPKFTSCPWLLSSCGKLRLRWRGRPGVPELPGSILLVPKLAAQQMSVLVFSSLDARCSGSQLGARPALGHRRKWGHPSSGPFEPLAQPLARLMITRPPPILITKHSKFEGHETGLCPGGYAGALPGSVGPALSAPLPCICFAPCLAPYRLGAQGSGVLSSVMCCFNPQSCYPKTADDPQEGGVLLGFCALHIQPQFPQHPWEQAGQG